MKTEKVIDIVFKHIPDKIMVYLRDKLIFNDDINTLKYYNYLENFNVYSYEYKGKEKNILIIRVMEN